MFLVIIRACGSLILFWICFLAELNIICIWTTLCSRIVFQRYSATRISLNFLNIHNEMIEGAASLGSTMHLEGLLLHPL